MALKSFLEKIFLGETLVEKVASPINGEIKIYDSWFGREMRIGGVTQSGMLVEKLWKVALSTVQSSKACPEPAEGVKVQSCLILGLGCGNAAKLINQKWPEAQITGIEIDPKVVEIGKKYFDLSRVPNLEIITDDAVKKILNTYFLILNTKFDLILVDLYLGKEYPKEAESKEFLNGVKNLLNNDGVAIFNRLSYGEYEKPANEFAEKLRQHFPKIWTKKAITNLLIFCFK